MRLRDTLVPAGLGIGAKVTIALCAIAILASVAVGLTTYWQLSRALADQELKQLGALAEVKSARFTAEMEALCSDAEFLAHAPVVQRTARALQANGVDPVSREIEAQLHARMIQFFTEMLRAKSSYAQIRFIGLRDGGREVVRVHRSSTEGELRVVPEAELQEKGGEPYFVETLRLADGDVYISEINLNREHGRVAEPQTPVVRAASPVYGLEGKLAGIVVINRFFATVTDELRHGLGDEHTLLMSNEQGEYLVHPDPARTFAFDRGSSDRIQDDHHSLAELIGTSLSRPVATIDTTDDGQRIAIGVCQAPFDPAHPDRYATIAVAASYDDAIAETAKSRIRSLLAGTGVLIIAVVCGYFVSRTLTKPMREIAIAAEAFGRGETRVSLPLDASGETGAVARALHELLLQVDTSHTALSRRAEELEQARCSALNLLQDVDAARGKLEASEREMRDHAARTQAILDGATDAIITINDAGIIESFNGAAERMFGYQANKVIGRNVRMLMPPPYRDEHDQYVRNYLETGISKIIGIGREVVGLRADGSTFPMDLAVSEVQLGDKRHFTGIVRDISKLKKALSDLTEAHDALQARAVELEAARVAALETLQQRDAARQQSLRAEQAAHDHAAKTQAILDGATDAIITINSAGIVESFNHSAERVFGYAPDRVIGRNVKMLMPSPYQDEHDQYIRNFLETGVAKIIGVGREVVGRRSDGSTFPMHLAVSVVKLGDQLLFTGIVRDISELRNAMQQLAEAHNELESRARQIERFNLDLRRSNDELKQFAYVASHDLQEPLRKVATFCQMLDNEYSVQLDENARLYIRYAVDGAVRMKSLMQDLLDYSRVETQGRPFEPTDAGSACAEAIDNLAVAIEESSTQVTRGPLPTIHADRAQLVRLFQNLIGNAIKYRGAEPPRIHVSVKEADGEWIFRVRDNGIGINPEYHERIFVIFQRLHARDKYSGTGIGLAVCKRIVERAGGRIWVESAEGAGSEFCFTMPKQLRIRLEHEGEEYYARNNNDVSSAVR